MAYQDLHEYINFLESKNLLKRIEAEVNPYLEVTEITDRIVKNGGPALLFTRIKGSEYPLAINLFGSIERMELALGVNSLDEIGQRFCKHLNLLLHKKGSILEKIRCLPQAAELISVFPKTVKKAPCQEIVEDNPDLDTLPILHCWPEDGGRFITLPLVYTKDALTGQQNCGMYRMHVYDKRMTGMHWHLQKDGNRHLKTAEHEKKRLDVAVALGADPAVIYAATAPLPPGFDEMIFAGFLRQKPVEMVKCKTVDLEVPAQAEFILEGYIDPFEMRLEGPFGDHTGYYSLQNEYPVFHVECLTRRKDAIYPATVVGPPPMEDCFLGKATERIFLPFIQMLFPEVLDMNFPVEGVFHNCVFVSIKKTYPGQAKKIMHGFWGLQQLMFTKLIIVVDEEIDVHNQAMVWWKVYNNIDAKRDVVRVEGPLDALDHASPRPNYGWKMGIDATRKWSSEGHTREWPNDVKMSLEVKELVNRRWLEYGFINK